MTDHAPGPWRLERTGSTAVSIYAADNSQIASFDLRYNPTRVEANARLLAAAPDLLKACELVLNDDIGCIGAMKAAISKAKGEYR